MLLCVHLQPPRVTNVKGAKHKSIPHPRKYQVPPLARSEVKGIVMDVMLPFNPDLSN